MKQIWSHVDLDYLRKNYPNLTAKEIAISLNRTVRSVYTKARDLKLKKSEEFLKSHKSGRLTAKHGEKTRFKKGNISWNKGKKISIGGRSVETRFKKGNIPHNHKPVGSIRINVDGYSETKIKEPNKWELTHRVVYEKYFGPIPEDCIVAFKNGDKTVICKENLEAITREEAIRSLHQTKEYAALLLYRDPDKRASILNDHPELIQVKQLQLELNKQIRSHE